MLLDLTGAVGIDAAASDGMVRVARAVRMLRGPVRLLWPVACRRADARQPAVDLQGIVSFPTLKAALSGALRGGR